ncbi:hypothetical protein JW926_15265 [Candidatus Sumerlaeota bacterium]|nr:hypothetical protein [Candidatus Sumerlaeota bacterium]
MKTFKFLTVVLAILILGFSIHAQDDHEERDYQTGVATRMNHFPYTSRRIFRKLMDENPFHDRRLDSEAQLIMINFDLSCMNDFLEQTSVFMNNHPDHPLNPEMGIHRIKAWNYLKNGDKAREEIRAYPERYPGNALNGELPLLELESYLKDGTIALRNQEASFQKRCGNLLSKSISHSRRTGNVKNYHLALSCGLKVSEQTGKKQEFIDLLGKEKTGIPRNMSWVLMEKTREAKGEIIPSRQKPQTPNQIMENIRGRGNTINVP